LLLQIGLWVFCSVSNSEGHSPQLGKELSGCFLAFVSAAAAFAFLLYGGRLWLMLRRFPIESRGRRKKLREVGLVTTICATCFLFRCVSEAVSVVWGYERGFGARLAPIPQYPPLGFVVLGMLTLCAFRQRPEPPSWPFIATRRSIIVAWSAFDFEDADLDVMGHPLLNLIYYSGAEIIPSALVLYILRKLPPKRQAAGYQPIPAAQ
jgi:hypothetical protein